MTTIFKNNGQTLASPTVKINTGEKSNLMSVFYDVSITGTTAASGNGVTYAAFYKPAQSEVWFPLTDKNDSAIVGTLSGYDVAAQGVLKIGYSLAGDLPLNSEMDVKVDLVSDNSVDTVVDMYVQLSSEKVVGGITASPPSVVMPDTPYEIVNENGAGINYTFTGYPDIASMGLTITDLSVNDSEYPAGGARFAIVSALNNITSNGANVANVSSNCLIAKLNGSDIDLVWPAISTNLIGRAGVANDSEDHRNYYVPLVDGKIVTGLNTVEEAGSNAFGAINVIGYVI
ncbi:MAG: hypothetical protein QM489_01025 [Candidatus Izemoplasma sp.]